MQFSTTRKKINFVLMSVILFIGFALIIASYFNDLREGRESALKRIGTISSTIAINVDARRIQRVKDQYPKKNSLESKTHDAWYYATHINLSRSAETNDLSIPIRILVNEMGQVQELITSAKDIEFRADYGAESNVIKHYYKNGGAIDLIDGEQPRWVSLNPIIDSRNKTIGVVCVEMSYAAVNESAFFNLVRNALIFTGVCLLLFLLFNRSVHSWLLNLEEGSRRIQERNQDIEESIEYATKIREALIPDEKLLSAEFDQHFLINKPKDRLSGDFHWFKRLDEHRRLLAVSDCTGHGVPGAMMVAIGCSALNEVVAETSWKDPGELLSALNTRMIEKLSQSPEKRGAGDGMDLALCLIDDRDNTVLFAGAYRPLYWMSDGELTVINGNRQPIGGNQHAADRKFSCHRISYRKGDRIYLFSDGYVDQFGGPENRKFLTSRFNDLLRSCGHLSLVSQAKLLEKTFEDWRGDQEQVDDVCLLAVELN